MKTRTGFPSVGGQAWPIQRCSKFCGKNGPASSWRVVERFEGVLEDKIWDEEGEELIRRYWIPLT